MKKLAIALALVVGGCCSTGGVGWVGPENSGYMSGRGEDAQAYEEARNRCISIIKKADLPDWQTRSKILAYCMARQGWLLLEKLED